MAVAETFAQLAKHMVKGLMVHDQMVNYFDFLGLDGFRLEQEKHYREESENYHRLCHFYMTHYGGLINPGEIANPNLIPQSWFKHVRSDVDNSTKRNGIENAFSEWKKWELEARKTYENAYKDLMSLNEVSAALFLVEFMKDVDEELELIDRRILALRSVDYDLVYVNELQDQNSK